VRANKSKKKNRRRKDPLKDALSNKANGDHEVGDEFSCDMQIQSVLYFGDKL